MLTKCKRMNRESILNGNYICADCENMINALDDEILNFEEKIKALNDFAGNDSEGKAAKAIKEKALELVSIIETMKEADEKDIDDLKSLADKVIDVKIDGKEVLEKKETARKEADSCYDKADALMHAARIAPTPWEADTLRGLSYTSKSQLGKNLRVLERTGRIIRYD